MITNVFKPKKEIPILNQVSGKISAGQVVAIMGPTGSGKVRPHSHTPVLVLVVADLTLTTAHVIV